MGFQEPNLQVPTELFLRRLGLEARSALVPCPQMAPGKMKETIQSSSRSAHFEEELWTPCKKRVRRTLKISLGSWSLFRRTSWRRWGITWGLNLGGCMKPCREKQREILNSFDFTSRFLWGLEICIGYRWDSSLPLLLVTLVLKSACCSEMSCASHAGRRHRRKRRKVGEAHWEASIQYVLNKHWQRVGLWS